MGPGLSRDLVVRAAPGTYVATCKPGMVGKGIRSKFTVTDSGKSEKITGVDQTTIDAATNQYAAYVRDQSQQLVTETAKFATVYKAGRGDEARKMFPHARQYWERIEPVAESFGDLDPKMDLRRSRPRERPGVDRLAQNREGPVAPGIRLRSDDPRPAGEARRRPARQHQDPRPACAEPELHLDKISNGSKELLDEVASSKITGEEEIWSHTDLYDIEANVDGARVGFEGLKPLLETKDPELAKEIEMAFDNLQRRSTSTSRATTTSSPTTHRRRPAQAALGRGQRARRAALEDDGAITL